MNAIVYPYTRLSSDITLSIQGVRIDNVPIPEYHVDEENRLVSLFSVERREWNLLEFDLEVNVSLQELKSKGLDDGATRALIRLNCGPTNFRAGKISEILNGRSTSTFTVTKAPMAKKARLECFVVRNGDDGIARILNEAEAWSIVLTEPQAKPLITRRKGGLQEFADIQWGDFSDQAFAGGALIQFSREAYYIDVTSEAPTLYLNRGIPGYETLLSENAGASRAERAFKDLEYRRVSLGVWLAFAYEAISCVYRDTDSGELHEPDGWRAQVLIRLLPRLFPGESLESAISKLATLRADGTADSIAGRMQIAINEIVGSSSTLRRQMLALIEE